MNQVIECGIGTITYTTQNSLLLVQLMENLKAAIKNKTPKEVNEMLESLTK